MFSVTPQLKIARSLVWNYGAYATEVVIGLGLIAFVVRHVSVAEYGVLSLALSIAGLLSILDFGLLGLLVQACVAARERGGMREASALLSAATAVLFLSGLAAFAFSVIIALLMPGPFEIGAVLVRKAVACLLLVGSSLIFSLPGMALELAYVSASAFGALSRIQIGIAILRAAATIALLSAGFGVVALAGIHLGLSVCRVLMLLLWLPSSTGGMRLSIRNASWARLRELRANRTWATGDNVARQIATSADSIILGILASPIAIATFAVSKRLPGHLQAIASRGIDVTLPLLAERHHRDEQHGLRTLFADTVTASALLLIPVCIGGIVFAPRIVMLLAGQDYMGAVPILRWLLVATITQAFSGPVFPILYARGEIEVAARIGILEAVANVALTILLVTRYGAVGAAIATVTTHVVSTFGWFLPAGMRAAGVSYPELMPLIVGRLRRRSAAWLDSQPS